MAAAPVTLKRVAPSEVKGLELSPLSAETLAQAQGIIDTVRKGEAEFIAIAEKFGDVAPGERGVCFYK